MTDSEIYDHKNFNSKSLKLKDGGKSEHRHNRLWCFGLHLRFFSADFFVPTFFFFFLPPKSRQGPVTVNKHFFLGLSISSILKEAQCNLAVRTTKEAFSYFYSAQHNSWLSS